MATKTAWRAAFGVLGFIGLLAIGASASLAQDGERDAPPTMKAIRYHERGDVDVLKLEDVPRPEPAAGELLVRVHAAGVNPVDWKIRAGKFPVGGLPAIPGLDVAGVVETVGEGVEAFAVGDAVYSYLPLGKGGAYAEFAAIPADTTAKAPEKIDLVHAAAVPLAALTAWQALFDHAELKQGQTVLIHGGSGGVGHFAVQLAKEAGATVIATASARNHEFLKKLGADRVIDYRTQRFEELVSDVDVVFDLIGGDTQERSFGVLKKGGFLVSIVGAPSTKKLEEHGVRGVGFLVKPDGGQLDELTKRIDAGKLVPEVSLVLPLADAARAHEQSETGHTRGKIVLRVVDDE